MDYICQQASPCPAYEFQIVLHKWVYDKIIWAQVASQIRYLWTRIGFKLSQIRYFWTKFGEILGPQIRYFWTRNGVSFPGPVSHRLCAVSYHC